MLVRGWNFVKNWHAVCTQKFCSHADIAEFTEAHWLRVLAMRGVGAMTCASACRGRTLCRPVVNLRTIVQICCRHVIQFTHNCPYMYFVKYKFYIHNIRVQNHGLKGQ